MEEIKTIEKKERIFRFVLWAVLEAFAVFSLVRVAVEGHATKILMGVFTMLLLTLPFVAAKVFKLQLNLAFFIFCELYAVGPMLGHIYKLYYYTKWWDDLLHTAGGVVFAIFGAYLAKFISKNNEPSLLMKAIFALCFSMAIAVAWEFIEYSCDAIFGSDMQNDTIVSFIHSYLIGPEMGQTGSIEGITDVIVNGHSLGLGGYLDIGLHDTINDMFVETLGAVVYTVIYIIDKEKHPVVYKITK